MPPKYAKGVSNEIRTPQVFNCRFRRLGKGRWIETEFLRRLNDGTVEVLDPRNGGVKTLFPNHVEVRTRGPRGGVKWVSAMDQDEPDDL